VSISLLPAMMFAQDCQSNPCPNIYCSDGAPVCTDSGYWVCGCTTNGDGTCYDSSDCDDETYSCVDGCCVDNVDCEYGACLSASDCGDEEDWSCTDNCCKPAGGEGSCDGMYNYDHENGEGCQCGVSADCASGWCSGDECIAIDPIIVDLSGAGFALTNARNGVKFDFFGDGEPVQMAWTAAGADVGWLALDRNGNGKIDDGAELFSNMTPQPPAPPGGKLGFKALAVYDLPVNGGNGDGLIDRQDAIFSKLLVWVDKNHNGVTDPGELLTMQQAGIQSISLSYGLSKWVDAYGNQFRYRSKITFSSGVPAGDQYVYDVILAGAPPTTDTPPAQ
jgi:hypothetical protein